MVKMADRLDVNCTSNIVVAIFVVLERNMNLCVI